MGARYLPLPYADAAVLSRPCARGTGVTGARFVRPAARTRRRAARGGADRPVWDARRPRLAEPARPAGSSQAAGLRWHVQVMGSGPVLLLVHGTGAATHSWRELAPLLAAALHGGGARPARARLHPLPPARRLVAARDGRRRWRRCWRALGVAPGLAVGHSAGAAILARMCLDGRIAPRALVSLNGALLPLRGLPGQMFSPHGQARSPRPRCVPRLFAWHAGPTARWSSG